jgi:WD40 repeat protein
MAWRLQLSDRPVRRLDILPSKPSILAAWTQPDRVIYLDLQSGSRVDDRVFDALLLDGTAARTGESWRGYLKAIKAPNGDSLPLARTPKFHVYSTASGDMHLYRGTELIFDSEGKETPLEVDKDAQFVALTMDRVGGTVAGLDRKARLHLFQKGARLGVFDLDLHLQDDVQPDITIADGGSILFVSDGQRIAICENMGKSIRCVNLHYVVGAVACSPDGKLLLVSDLDAGVLRVYSGKELKLTHQRFAADLLADAKRTQLMTTSGGSVAGVALGPLVMGMKGQFAFAIAGMVCATNVARMKVPRTQVS